MFVGSEGSLGVITEAWMRLQDRPRFRASAAVTFAEFATAVEAVRVLSQSGLNPSNLRLLDANEALTSGAGNGAENVLIVGFESADHQLDAWMERAVEICREHGGTVPDEAVRTHSEGAGARQGAAGTWRKSFLQAPYIRDSLVRLGFVSETFETAITWDRFEDFHASVSQAARQAIEQICGSGMLSCRFTHVYPDGPAPYFSVLAPARAGSQLAQWDELKSAVSEALHAAGGTITHHHAVGRDHRPWYDRQRPGGFADALSAAKGSLDPGAIMNPGVIV
jgi:alkyldihydroxyacetonephosphate synthase